MNQKKLKLLITVIIFFLFGDDGSASDLTKLVRAEKPIYKTIRDSNGKNYKLITKKISNRQSSRYQVQFLWISIPGFVKLNVENVQQYASVKNLFEENSFPTDIVVVNGGFWRNDIEKKIRVPDGLVISGKQLISPKRDWSEGGVLLQKIGIISIKKVAGYIENSSLLEAIQSKPILVWKGLNDIRADDGIHVNRVAIGFNDIGNIVIGALIGPNGQGGSLYEFAELLALGVNQGGPGIITALNMDGGPGAHLYFPSLKYHVGDDVINYIPNLIRLCSRC